MVLNLYGVVKAALVFALEEVEDSSGRMRQDWKIQIVAVVAPVLVGTLLLIMSLIKPLPGPTIKKIDIVSSRKVNGENQVLPVPFTTDY